MQAFLTTQLLGQNAGQFLPDFKSQNMALNTAMPGSKYAADYGKMVSQLEAQLTQQQGGGANAVQIGQLAPDVTSTDPSGKTRSLSALKGKVVLLDFWASWCGPCRRENPHVVEVYNKYKSKGFEVFSVSLDREDGKQKWVDAIKQDGLVWDNHVSDLKWWQSPAAQTYGVNSIPRTFLLDREGKIVAINPRQDLESALLKVL
jgi:peroxiredoxin